MAGVTFLLLVIGLRGLPAHEHASLLEEAYLYIDMLNPHRLEFSLYIQSAGSELVQVVREGDCVVMPQGYHANVAAPGGQINFLWMMAAIKEGEDPPVRCRERATRICCWRFRPGSCK